MAPDNRIWRESAQWPGTVQYRLTRGLADVQYVIFYIVATFYEGNILPPISSYSLVSLHDHVVVWKTYLTLLYAGDRGQSLVAEALHAVVQCEDGQLTG